MDPRTFRTFGGTHRPPELSRSPRTLSYTSRSSTIQTASFPLDLPLPFHLFPE
ncbi:hypothetical protein ACRALDRAFT_2023466 [Sodiomyces alcalophilus JCM 7366]|uniref:uncharacterized protein n=1 Tax=Sodiomyces alcalophilus JCM 7366 TaxID=591952 RepID=UPI0039B3C477